MIMAKILLIVLYGCIVSISFSQQTSRPVIQTPTQLTYKVTRGHSVTLECNLDPQKNLKVTDVWWEDKENRKITIDRQKYSGGNLHYPNLTIHHGVYNDNGTYTCYAKNSRENSSIRATVFVGDPPTVVLKDKHYGDIGTPATLVCECRNAERVEWYHQEYLVPIGGRYTLGTLPLANLVISKLTWADAGRYRCLCYNVFGSLPAETELAVSAKAEKGQFITLRTYMIGTHYNWFRTRYYDLNDNWKYKGTRTAALTINEIDFDDTFTYNVGCYVNGSWSTQLIKLSVVGLPVILTQTELTYTVVRGQSATLKCNLDPQNNPKVTDVRWKKIGNRKIIVDNKKYSGGSLQRPSLTIYNGEYNDNGTYTCNAKNSKGTSFIRATVFVGDPPSIKLNNKHFGEMGKTATLVCDCSNANRVEWYHQKRLVSIGGRFTFGTLPSANLVISRLGSYDAGIYRCQCFNKFGNSSKDTLLAVDYPPRITLERKHYGELGKAATLVCDCYNANRVIWYHQERLVSIEGRYTLGTLPSANLVISQLGLYDAGRYRCKCSNNFGNSSKNTTLVVGAKPTFETTQQSINAEIGKEIEIKVNIKTSPSIPLLSVEWRHNDVIVEGRHYRTVTTSYPNLLIYYVGDKDDGNYTCTIDNGVGVASQTFSLTTWSTPLVKLYVNNKYAPVNSTVTIRAEVTSKPPVSECVWSKKDNNNIINQLEFTFNRRYEYDTLTIENIQLEDAGTFICDANNRFSKGRGETKIFVGEITTASIPKEVFIGRYGEDITLDCIFRGQANVTWCKDYSCHTTLFDQNENAVLAIDQLKLTDAGNYTCNVVNLFGRSSDSAYLHVLYVRISAPTLSTNIKANETIKFECHMRGSHEIHWVKDGTTLKKVTDYYDELTLVNVTRNYTGNYTCETTRNGVTATSSTEQVLVQDYPVIYTPTNFLRTLTASELQLYCDHDTYPEPTSMFWTKNGQNISQTKSIQKYNISYTSKPMLTILNSDISDIGRYACCIENGIGRRCSEDIRVLIEEPEHSRLAGPVSGTIVGLLVGVVLVLGIIIIRRKRQKLPTERCGREEDQNVQFIQDPKGGGVYANISGPPEKGLGPSIENVFPDQIQTGASGGETSYYNIEDLITTIRVSDLRAYIGQKQSNNSLQKQFKDIPYGSKYPTTISQMKENAPKNRYKTTLPYDHSRVILESSEPDYINANYIDGFEKAKCYIASQGPLKSTLNDYWNMIWQENIQKIVMLTNLVEGDKIKCHQYWPSGGEKMKCGDIVLTLLSEKERAAYTTREITVEKAKTKETRKVTQFHFTAWPDHGTPDPLHLCIFYKHVMADLQRDNGIPILVHCSAGIGRTGTFIGLDALYKEGMTTQCVDVYKYVKKMRYCRMNMIQTKDQYVFLHSALLELFTSKDTMLRNEEFERVWRDFQADNGPMNQRRLKEEYEMLQAKMTEHQPLQYTDAASDTNIMKNRNKNVLASDSTRLFLTSFEQGRTDYINAVQAPSYTKFVGYLVTQLPLPDTMVDFWTMISDHNSSTVVLLLNDEKEADMVYTDSSEGLKCRSFLIKLTRTMPCENNIDEKTVSMSRKNEKTRTIKIYQFVFKNHLDAASLCSLVNVISTRIDMSRDPVTVVSSDGAKNCGMFCAFVNAVYSTKIDHNADIFQLVRLLKLRQPEFMSDFEEYKLCYEAINLHLETSNVYANC